MIRVLFVLFGSAGFAAQLDDASDFDIPKQWTETCDSVVPEKCFSARNAEAYGLEECVLRECCFSNVLSLSNQSDSLELRFNKSANFFQKGVICSITVRQKDADNYMHWCLENQGFCGNSARVVIKASEGEEPFEKVLYCGAGVSPPSLSCQYEFGDDFVAVKCFLGEECYSTPPALKVIIDYDDFREIPVYMCSAASTYMLYVFTCDWGDTP